MSYMLDHMSGNDRGKIAAEEARRRRQEADRRAADEAYERWRVYELAVHSASFRAFLQCAPQGYETKRASEERKASLFLVD